MRRSGSPPFPAPHRKRSMVSHDIHSDHYGNFGCYAVNSILLLAVTQGSPRLRNTACNPFDIIYYRLHYTHSIYWVLRIHDRTWIPGIHQSRSANSTLCSNCSRDHQAWRWLYACRIKATDDRNRQPIRQPNKRLQHTLGTRASTVALAKIARPRAKCMLRLNVFDRRDE